MVEEDQQESSKLWPQFAATFAATLLAVSCGLHYGWASPAVPKLLTRDLHFAVDDVQISYIIILLPAAYIIGCPLSAILLDKIGRKKSILVLAFPQILAWLLIANANNISILYVGRFVAGISEGGTFTTVPIYIAEISEPKIRGTLGTFFTMAFIFGILLVNSYTSFMHLKTAAYVSISMPLLFLMIFVWMPESPYYYIIKDKQEKARFALRQLRKMANVEEELTELTADVHRQISEPSQIKDIFTIKSNLKGFLVLVGLRTLQHFTGGASISFYNQLIFLESKVEFSYTASSIIFFTIFFAVGLVATPLVDKIGRKPILLISTGGCVFATLCETLYFWFLAYGYDLSLFSWVPLSALILYTSVRGAGLMSIPSLMAGEIFSASIKSKAVALINLYLAFSIASSSKAFQALSEKFGLTAPFLFFTIVGCFGILFIIYFVPETKGKTLEEIQQDIKEHVNQ